MSDRVRLANRRLNISERIVWDDRTYLIAVGFNENGEVREVFLDGIKVGSDHEGLIDDVCVLISRLLQHGDQLGDLARTLTREGPAPSAASIIGHTLQRLLKIQLDCGEATRLAYRSQKQGGRDGS